MARSRDISKVLSSSTALATDVELSNYTPLSSPVTSYKNKIINGGFDIWQRGTSFNTNNVYSADRWIVGFATGSFAQVGFTTGANDIPGYEPRFYGRWTISSNSQNYELTQKIESVRTFAGQTVTLSFWARISSGTVAFGPRLVQHFGTGGSPSSLVVTGISSQTVTSSWQRFSYTVSVPSISAKTIGTNNDDSLWVSFQISNANTGAIDIWGVQLEKGSIATEFEQRHIADELRLCQRYFIRFMESVGFIGGAAGNSNNSTLGRVFPVIMRAAPTMSHQNTRTTDYYTAGGTNSALTSWHIQPHCAFVVATHGNLYGGGRQVVYLESSGGTSYVEYAIEL